MRLAHCRHPKLVSMGAGASTRRSEGQRTGSPCSGHPSVALPLVFRPAGETPRRGAIRPECCETSNVEAAPAAIEPRGGTGQHCRGALKSANQVCCGRIGAPVARPRDIRRVGRTAVSGRHANGAATLERVADNCCPLAQRCGCVPSGRHATGREQRRSIAAGTAPWRRRWGATKFRRTGRLIICRLRGAAGDARTALRVYLWETERPGAKRRNDAAHTGVQMRPGPQVERA